MRPPTLKSDTSKSRKRSNEQRAPTSTFGVSDWAQMFLSVKKSHRVKVVTTKKAIFRIKLLLPLDYLPKSRPTSSRQITNITRHPHDA